MVLGRAEPAASCSESGLWGREEGEGKGGIEAHAGAIYRRKR